MVERALVPLPRVRGSQHIWLATAPFGRSGAWGYDEEGVDEAMCQKSEWLTLRLYLEPLSLGVTA